MKPTMESINKKHDRALASVSKAIGTLVRLVPEKQEYFQHMKQACNTVLEINYKLTIKEYQRQQSSGLFPELDAQSITEAGGLESYYVFNYTLGIYTIFGASNNHHAAQYVTKHYAGFWEYVMPKSKIGAVDFTNLKYLPVKQWNALAKKGT